MPASSTVASGCAHDGNFLAEFGDRGTDMNLVIYLIGTLLVVAGLAYGANRLGVSHVWIIVGALVITGFGLMAGIVKTRQKDPA
jgi:hypothetical protein